MRLLLTTAATYVAFLSFAGPARAEWIWPLEGDVITPYRNGDDPYAGGQHRGIDIAGSVGARVVAASGGDVRFAGTAGSSGLTVSVRTADGRFDTSYLHLASISVREGQSVSTGETLGAVGVTGSRSASEPHLHFGVRESGTRHSYRDPLDFLPPRPGSPAPEGPHPTPVPVPAPTPATPVPSPVPERVPRGAPEGGRAPRQVPLGDRVPRRVPAGEPAPRRVPLGDPAPGRVPAADRHGTRVPVSDPAPRGAPAAAPAPRGAPNHAPVADRSPRSMPLGGPAADGSPHHAPSGGPGRQPAPEPRGPGEGARSDGPTAAGPDIGWILACVGLLAAAAMLGLTEDGRKATRKSRSQLLRLLRPLTGRG
jgi:Peptidase family M23